MESRDLLSTITDFPTPTPTADPASIVTGPDGNLWFTEFAVNKIGMMNPTAHVTVEFPMPAANSNPYSITSGPDGNLWFTELNNNKVGMINPTTRTINEFPLPNANSGPAVITAGPDGNLWFTEENLSGNRIGMINPSTHVIMEFRVPTVNAFPFGITSAPDGNLWFTESIGNKIGMINPSSHAFAEYPLPTPNADMFGITTGADGNLWFTMYTANRIGTFNLATHAITESALPAANSDPVAITSGPDGNLWFSEAGPTANRVGAINPVTHGISELTSPTPNSTPGAITSGPDGNVWYTEIDGSKIGLVVPTRSVVVASEPPARVATNVEFGLTVDVTYETGVVDTTYNGAVKLALENNPGGATLGGLTTVTAHNGVATFSGLTLNEVGAGYRLVAYTDPLTTTVTSPVTVATPPTPQPPAPVETPPTVVAEKVITIGQRRRRRVVGFELDFSKPLDAARASNVANYMLTQTNRHGRTLATQAVNAQATYSAATHSVMITLMGKVKFAAGGRLVVNAQAPNGITDTSGAFLDGGNLGAPGSNAAFVIAAKGSSIAR
jgi:virginiamycin B lyase